MSYIEFNKETYYNDLFIAIKNIDRLTFRELFLRLHDRDKNEVFHLVDDQYKKNIAELLHPEEFEDMFKIMPIQDQDAAIDYLPNEYIVEVFDHLPYDDIAYFINRSNVVDETFVLKYLGSSKQKEVLEILSYASETAGSIMTKEFISVYETQTIPKVIQYLRQVGEDAETIYTIYVVDEHERLIGVFSLRELLMAPKNKTIADIMNSQVIHASVDLDQEEAADLMQDYDLTALPVISHDRKLKGIITIDDIIDVLEQEAEEDFNEFAGIRKQDIQNESGKRKNVVQMALSRTPWLVIFMVSGLFIGNLMNLFESTLQQAVLLSVFIPAIMDTAGNVGTQSLAVTISQDRLFESTLSEKLKAIRMEILSGLSMGFISSIMMLAIITFVYRDFTIAFIVSLTLTLTIVVSAVVGTVIPMLFDRLGFDTSVASGPFITIISDALSLLFYFSIATIIIG